MNVTASTAAISQLGPDFYNPFTLVIATDLDFNTLSMVNAATRVTNKSFYGAGSHGLYGYIFADLIQHDYVIERAKSNVATVIGPESATRSIISATTKRENDKTVELVTKREIYSPLLLANSSPLPPDILNSTRKLKNVSPLLPCFRALWDFGQEHNGAIPSHSQSDLQSFTRKAHEKVKELQMPVECLKSEFLRSFLQNLGSELAPVTAFLGGMIAQDAINVLGMRQQPIQNLVLFDGEESKGPIYALHPIFEDGLDSMAPMATEMAMPDMMDPNAMAMPMGGMDGTFDGGNGTFDGMNGFEGPIGGMDSNFNGMNGTIPTMTDMDPTEMAPVIPTDSGAGSTGDNITLPPI